MLNQHFVRPATADRIRSSWFGDAIERYVDWLDEKRYAAGSVHLRVPLLVRFGQFAHSSGARAFDELPRYVEPFVKHWLEARGPGHSESERRRAARVIRGPIQHFLKLIVPNHPNDRVCVRDPFVDTAPGFFEFLRRDRGLREGTVGRVLSASLRDYPLA